MTNIPLTPAVGNGAASKASAPKTTEAAVSTTSAKTAAPAKVTEPTKPVTTAKAAEPTKPVTTAKAAAPAKHASPAISETSDAKTTEATVKAATKSKAAPKRKYTKKTKIAAKPTAKTKVKATGKPKAALRPKAATKVKVATKATKKTAKKQAKSTVASPVNTAILGLEQASEAFEDGIRNFQQEWFGKTLEMGDLHIANVELHDILESSRDATLNSISELNSEMQKFVEKNVEDGLSTGREILKAKSVPEMFEIQSKAAQDQFQACLEHGRNMSAIATRTAQEAMKPVSGNWTETIEKFYKQMTL